MSLVPALINELLDDYRRPFFGNMYDQNFGMGLFNDEILTPRSSLLSVPLRCGYLRPWRTLDADDSGVSAVTSDSKEFKVNLDVQQFKPEELKVKVVDDYLVVDGKHEERSDQHGFISRQFTRRYKMPEDVDKAALVSNLSSDGVLTLKAPKLALQEKASREIPITQTNAPAVKPKKTEKKGERMEE
ncbi:alpha-crystallin A chain-like isoform X2 [Rhodnius prolixus]|uniref:alpha-crystallin A chain-like isoform X2 n=1 Tax=Rhodnius prolixus TaxID=13249 RepID=UPI003D1885B3